MLATPLDVRLAYIEKLLFLTVVTLVHMYLNISIDFKLACLPPLVGMITTIYDTIIHDPLLVYHCKPEYSIGRNWNFSSIAQRISTLLNTEVCVTYSSPTSHSALV